MPDSRPAAREPSVRTVSLPTGARLSVRLHRPAAPGRGRPFLLVHGLASNARLWDDVAIELSAHGHEAAAVDLRGHGASDSSPDGHATEDAAADVRELLEALGWTGPRAAVLVGQSWGGNVVLEAAALDASADSGRRVAAVGLVDGGWLRLRDAFPTFEECWERLAPPRLDGLSMGDLRNRLTAALRGWPAGSVDAVLACFRQTSDGTVRARLDRAHHRSILHSLWAGDPRSRYGLVSVPALLVPAVAPPSAASGDEERDRAARSARAVDEAASMLPDAVVRPYAGAHHDLHLQHPAELAADLLVLAARGDLVAARAEDASGAAS